MTEAEWLLTRNSCSITCARRLAIGVGGFFSVRLPNRFHE
jgi:hypothetical protein